MDWQDFSKAISNSLAEIKQIAVDAAGKPTVYYRDRIDTWGNKLKVFSEIAVTAENEIRARWLGTDVPAVDPSQYVAEFTGATEKSEAVLSGISFIEQNYGVARMAMESTVWWQAFSEASPNTALEILSTYVLGVLRSFSMLYRTAVVKMAQGPKPAPVPGPGQIIKNTPFGPGLVDVSGIPVGTLNALDFESLESGIIERTLRRLGLVK